MYFINERGDIWSKPRTYSKGGWLKKKIDKDGYYECKLFVNGKRIYRRSHRLVYGTHVGPLVAGMEIDHIDGNRKNNSIANLRQLTSSQNQRAYQKACGVSLFRGVHKAAHGDKWHASIWGNNGKSIHLGYFDREVDAAISFNKKAIELGYLPEALNQIPK